VSVEEGIDHVFKCQRDQRVRDHRCASPDVQGFLEKGKSGQGRYWSIVLVRPVCFPYYLF
jgi:hypothetical protein